MLVTTHRCVGALVGTRDDLCRGYGAVPPPHQTPPTSGHPQQPSQVPVQPLSQPHLAGQHHPGAPGELCSEGS